MIAFTTRNRPHVLEYSLRKTREIYDGLIIVIDDNSDEDFNKDICKKYDCAYLYNETRRGIPRSKERGFRSLLSFDRQFWFDDDCFPKAGFFERMEEAMQHQGHLLHLKQWAHIKPLGMYVPGIIRYNKPTACMMAFTKELYDDIHGFPSGFGLYGGWHETLSRKLGGFYAVKDSSKYIHSFDVDGIPYDLKGTFASSVTKSERLAQNKKYG